MIFCRVLLFFSLSLLWFEYTIDLSSLSAFLLAAAATFYGLRTYMDLTSQSVSQLGTLVVAVVAAAAAAAVRIASWAKKKEQVYCCMHAWCSSSYSTLPPSA